MISCYIFENNATNTECWLILSPFLLRYPSYDLSKNFSFIRFNLVKIYMDNNAQYLLRSLIHECGIDIIHKPLQFDTIFREYAKGQFKPEIYLLVLSSTTGVVDKLLENNSSPLNTLANQLSLQLYENLGIDKSSASWAIDSWIFALNLKVDLPPLNLARAQPRNYFSERNRESGLFFNVEQSTKQLAVLFADICGSTSLYESIGDDLARHFISICIKIMVKNIAPYKGKLIKTIGDEIMCIFPNATLALNAACAMQIAVKNNMADLKQQLSIRIGFHYGSVICEANDVFGDTVNVAARVAGLAKAEQIMTTDAVYANLPDELQKKTKPYKSINLKGKQQQCDIYWVLWKKNDEEQELALPHAKHFVTSPYVQVILKHIPQNTTRRQILQFVKPALEGGLFSKSGTIEHISILVYKDHLSHIMEFHAILSIQPDEAAKRIINTLHRKPLNGHHIAVMEYIERSIYNNSRVIYTKDEHPKGNCLVDRRDSRKRFKLITIEQLKDFTWIEEHPSV